MVDIKLHKEYGVNPTIPVCYWCGHDKNEVALLGAAYPGEAPMRMVIDQAPCEDCIAAMANGITVMEGDENKKFTGRWLVLKEESVRRWRMDEKLKESILHKRMMMADKELYAKMLEEGGE